ncbi:MAG: hypothetical protein H6624_17655 [Bdellovibrionaceae bacterium]|nr:hypothetical protein [Pseudobdellovibrionaceae bacterium]
MRQRPPSGEYYGRVTSEFADREGSKTTDILRVKTSGHINMVMVPVGLTLFGNALYFHESGINVTQAAGNENATGYEVHLKISWIECKMEYPTAVPSIESENEFPSGQVERWCCREVKWTGWVVPRIPQILQVKVDR